MEIEEIRGVNGPRVRRLQVSQGMPMQWLQIGSCAFKPQEPVVDATIFEARVRGGVSGGIIEFLVHSPSFEVVELAHAPGWSVFTDESVKRTLAAAQYIRDVEELWERAPLWNPIYTRVKCSEWEDGQPAVDMKGVL